MQVAHSDVKQIELVATVIRADGRREELGVVDYWHKNPIKRFIWSFKKLFRRK
jgi:hypothetical protein